MSKTAVVILSGGLDSVTLAHHLKAEGWELSLLSFDYGQRHGKELEFARRCAERLGAPWHRVDLSGLQALLPGSSLTDPGLEVPEGHYAADNMKVTVVPNRNAIMLSCAWGHAVAIGAQAVAFGAHAGDHFIYPDCRPEFHRALQGAFQVGNEGFGDPDLYLLAPFLHLSKADIAARAAQLRVPIEETWSCYKGGEHHCGKCGTCVERIEALFVAGVEDPTVYEEA